MSASDLPRDLSVYSVPVLKDGVPTGKQVTYTLPPLPDDPLILVERRRTEAQMATYLRWLNDLQESRPSVFGALLTEIGAPPVRTSADLPALGSFIQAWFGSVAEPFVDQGSPHRQGTVYGYFTDFEWDRLGRALVSAPFEGRPEYVVPERLLVGLTHDLATLVANLVMQKRPDVRWTACWAPHHLYAALGPSDVPYPGVLEIRELLLQGTARIRGKRTLALMAWASGALSRVYQNAVEDLRCEMLNEAFTSQYPRPTTFRKPKKTDSAVPHTLVDLVADLRQVGLVRKSKLSDIGLATAMNNAWRSSEGDDLPLDRSEASWRLLVIDGARTWTEEVDIAARPAAGLYRWQLDALTAIGGRQLTGIYGGAEDWSSDPLNVLLTFDRGSREYCFTIPRSSEGMSAGVILGLNELLAAGSNKFYFLDVGRPRVVVIRATEEELATLRTLTRLDFTLSPPGWWDEMAPTPQPSAIVSFVSKSRPRSPRRPSTTPRMTIKPTPTPTAHAPQAGRRTIVNQPREGETPSQSFARVVSEVVGVGDEFHPDRLLSPSAPEIYDSLLRERLVPGLRALGFKGTGGTYYIDHGDFRGTLNFQKSRHNTKALVEFTINLWANHRQLKAGYWSARLGTLTPQRSDMWWKLPAGASSDAVAEDLHLLIGDYGLPALTVAIDNPEFPPEPDRQWPRTFDDPINRQSGTTRGPPFEHRDQPFRLEDSFEALHNSDFATRGTAMDTVARWAPEDPRVAPALLDALEREPRSYSRASAALWIAFCPVEPGDARAALEAASRGDEVLEVRLMARYGLALVNRRPSSERP